MTREEVAKTGPSAQSPGCFPAPRSSSVCAESLQIALGLYAPCPRSADRPVGPVRSPQPAAAVPRWKRSRRRVLLHSRQDGSLQPLHFISSLLHSRKDCSLQPCLLSLALSAEANPLFLCLATVQAHLQSREKLGNRTVFFLENTVPSVYVPARIRSQYQQHRVRLAAVPAG